MIFRVETQQKVKLYICYQNRKSRLDWYIEENIETEYIKIVSRLRGFIQYPDSVCRI